MDRPDAAPPPAPATPDEVALRDYLANMRLLAEAQREVMMSFRRVRQPDLPAALKPPRMTTIDALSSQGSSRVNGTSTGGVQRLLLETVNLRPATPSVNLAGQTFAVVSDPWDGLGELTERLKRAGADVQTVPPRRGAPAETQTEQALERLGPLDGVVHLGGLDATAPVDARGVFTMLRPTFTSRCSTFVAAVSTGHDRSPTIATGTVGMMRSLARDLTDRNVRVVEFAGDPPDPGEAARLLADEVIDAHAGTGPVTVVYRDRARTTSLLGKAQAVDRSRPALPLHARSVVVVTGGARGVTARCTVAIARATGCRVEILGRTPASEAAEDPTTALAADRPALRQLLREQDRSSTPAGIESRCDEILAAREVRSTLHALGQLGTPARYHQVDVRNGAALAQTLADIRRQHGRIDAIVHAAGAVHDRLAQDKSDDGFDRVFATKVDAARTLLEQVGDDLRLVVLFGSLSAVVGHRGQVDHSAASQAMGELATRLDGMDGRRVVCIHWGPWLTDERNGSTRRSAGLIHPDDGAMALLQEMATLPGEPSEVVIMRADPAATVTTTDDDHPHDRLAIPPGEAGPGRATPSARPGHLAGSRGGP